MAVTPNQTHPDLGKLSLLSNFNPVPSAGLNDKYKKGYWLKGSFRCFWRSGNHRRRSPSSFLLLQRHSNQIYPLSDLQTIHSGSAYAQILLTAKLPVRRVYIARFYTAASKIVQDLVGHNAATQMYYMQFYVLSNRCTVSIITTFQISLHIYNFRYHISCNFSYYLIYNLEVDFSF